jgi:tetratricopeptide (TPR) repeat protein
MAAASALSLALLWQAGTAFARGAAEEVAAGNAAFSRGEVEKAVGLYDRARRARSSSVVPLLDFGIALYEKGDYAAALTAFQEIQSPGDQVAAEVHYDQGSALARLGKNAEKDHPDAALDFYRRSVAAYKRALVIDPGLSAAAANVEVVREWIKSLSDSQSSNGQQPQQEQGNGSNQGGQTQTSPSPNAQPPGGQGTNPGQAQQTPQTPANPPSASGQPGAPLSDTAEAILQEERDRRQAEATAGGNTANATPNW